MFFVCHTSKIATPYLMSELTTVHGIAQCGWGGAQAQGVHIHSALLHEHLILTMRIGIFQDSFQLSASQTHITHKKCNVPGN